MNSKAVILGSFVGSVAIITWRDFTNPDPSWPFPVPPPYRYIGAGVAFGLLGLVADTLNDRIAAVIAFGLLIGLAFRYYNGGVAVEGSVPNKKQNRPTN